MYLLQPHKSEEGQDTSVDIVSQQGKTIGKIIASEKGIIIEGQYLPQNGSVFVSTAGLPDSFMEIIFLAPEYNGTFDSVREVAKRIACVNWDYYDESLVNLIPKEILDMKLNDDSDLIAISEMIDESRFAKERELASLVGISPEKYPLEESRIALSQIINAAILKGALPEEQEKIRREICFLFNVAASVAHH